jgi:hypothetical protein
MIEKRPEKGKRINKKRPWIGLQGRFIGYISRGTLAGESEPKLAMGWLAAALTLGKRGFLGGEVHGRAGEHFVDVAAHDAAAVGAVPIALDDHRATALGA